MKTDNPGIETENIYWIQHWISVLETKTGLCNISHKPMNVDNKTDKRTQMSIEHIKFGKKKKNTRENTCLIMRCFQSCPRKFNDGDNVQWTHEKFLEVKRLRKTPRPRILNVFKRINDNRGLDIISVLISSCQTNARARGKKGREEAGVCTINRKWFDAQWKKQGGYCEYLDIPLTTKQGCKYVVSIERLDDNKGYIPENCVLICSEVQVSCGWSKKFADWIFSD
jgi:hypothetical protein